MYLKSTKIKKLHAKEWELNGLYEQNQKKQNWILYIIFALVLLSVCHITVMFNLDIFMAIFTVVPILSYAINFKTYCR